MAKRTTNEVTAIRLATALGIHTLQQARRARGHVVHYDRLQGAERSAAPEVDYVRSPRQARADRNRAVGPVEQRDRALLRQDDRPDAQLLVVECGGDAG